MLCPVGSFTEQIEGAGRGDFRKIRILGCTSDGVSSHQFLPTETAAFGLGAPLKGHSADPLLRSDEMDLVTSGAIVNSGNYLGKKFDTRYGKGPRYNRWHRQVELGYHIKHFLSRLDQRVRSRTPKWCNRLRCRLFPCLFDIR